MVKVTLSNLVPATLPTNGWIVEYRKKGTLGAYITAVGSPFMSFPIEFTTTDAAGTLYEGHIKNDCNYSQSINLNWSTPCDCTGVGFTPTVDNTQCSKSTIIPATVTNSGYCLARSGNTDYSVYGSRIYNLGFTLATILLPPASTDTYIYGSMSGGKYDMITGEALWSNSPLGSNHGPMNRESVWIDSDCDGNIDSLGVGVKTTISTLFNNVGGVRTIFIGVGADNQFKIVVNGIVVVDTLATASSMQFRMWHIIPIQIKAGVNYVNLVGTGDGTVDDSIAMMLYDNTAAQILAATRENQLNILFRSGALDGSTFDIATCPANYSLDSSGGSTNYTCVGIETKICNSIA